MTSSTYNLNISRARTVLYKVVRGYSCLCALQAKVDHEELAYYYLHCTKVDMSFSVFARYLDRYQNPQACTLEFWSKDICAQVKPEYLVSLYENRNQDLLQLMGDEKKLLDTILKRLQGCYNWEAPRLMTALGVHLRDHYVKRWLQGKSLMLLSLWFRTNEASWETYASLKWFTKKEGQRLKSIRTSILPT